MLTHYIGAAMRRAKYEILSDDSSFYGEIPEFDGVYANANTLEACREELEEVLEEWIPFRVSKSLPLPVVDGVKLNISIFDSIFDRGTDAPHVFSESRRVSE